MKIRRRSHVAWRRIDDETFVINLDRKVMYGLNATGGDLWAMLEEGRDLVDIIASVAASFDIDTSPQDLEFPVYRFLHQLKTHQLITFDADLEVTEAPRATPETSPQIVWQENLSSVGYSCAQKPGQTPACTQVPSQ